MPDHRPDPDQLLNRLKQEDERARYGKLKIFFGSCAGVGKTYAMLSTARQLRLQGLDVVVGVVETHGRSETAVLLDGVEKLPLKEITYRDRVLKEFDLDGALARQPALILVDELAHTNVSGSRHPKRYQDIEELLSAGIDVYTTVNVQHLESLNDVVGGITGIRVWETVPDRIFDEADEVILVDLPPDELLLRLKEGKVYLPQQAERATRNFFRKGNLMALRELSLRRMADRVDEEIQVYRRDKSVTSVWQTRESLLACVGPDSGGEKIVRSAGRIAAQLKVPWHAIYIETPKLQRLPEARRQRILKTLKLAQELGAQTATLSGQSVTETVVEYARSRNLTKTVVGSSSRRWWQIWHRPLIEQLARHAPDLDIVQVFCEQDKTTTSIKTTTPAAPPRIKELPWKNYTMSVATCVLTTALASLLFPHFDLANIVMLFLLTVLLVALKYGRGPAILASFLNVAAFDFFFVPPRFSFAVSDIQYLLTFAVMLSVALVTVHLTTGLRYQARVAMHRESRVRALYEMARELSGALLPEQVTQISNRFIKTCFDSRTAVLLPDEHERIRLSSEQVENIPELDLGVAQWAYDHGEVAGFGTDTLPGSPSLYLPLKAPMRVRGVLAIQPIRPRWLMIPEQRRLLDTLAALTAISLERVHFVDVAQNALVRMEAERLRNSLLAGLSHDLRTPLTVIIGLASVLKRTKPDLSDEQEDIATTIRDEASRMNALVNNLLDMARLQGGKVHLHTEWQPFEEVVGSTLKAMGNSLLDHNVFVRLPPNLPLLEFDAVLVERLLINLLENAVKYTQAGSNIRLEASLSETEVEISVSDNGPGLPPGSEKMIFEKFTRAKQESSIPGVGLGLAICQAIVEAHNGRIWAENLPSGGARFVFTLPLGHPPKLEVSEHGIRLEK